MNVVRLVGFCCGSLAAAGGLVLLAAPAASAASVADCTGLLGCTTRDVGDTVRKAGRGDLPGTVGGVGKTVGDAGRKTGDTVDGVRKRLTGGTGAPGGSSGSGGSGPGGGTGSGGTGGTGGAGGSTGSGGHQHGAQHGGQHGTAGGCRHGCGSAPRAHRQGSAVVPVGPSSGADLARWVSLQQWQGPRLPLGGLRARTGTTTSAAQRDVPPPQVADPPAARTGTVTRRAGYLSAVPAADSRPPATPLPAVPVFAATALAGTVGIAVLGVYSRRSR